MGMCDFGARLTFKTGRTGYEGQHAPLLWV